MNPTASTAPAAPTAWTAWLDVAEQQAEAWESALAAGEVFSWRADPAPGATATPAETRRATALHARLGVLLAAGEAATAEVGRRLRASAPRRHAENAWGSVGSALDVRG